MPPFYDVLIIGSGAAGLSTALRLSGKGGKIAVLSKGPLREGSTYYAQGGIAAVLDDKDSFESHVNDTLRAGAGLCHKEVVEYTVAHAPDAIRWLIETGVSFSPGHDNPSGYHLNQEGGHSHRRIIHAADATGKAVETTLEQAVKSRDDIDIFEHFMAVDLLTTDRHAIGITDAGRRCFGAYILNTKTQQVTLLRARFVVLATGGASKVYLYTSNPDISSGDGIAMAWRAGCSVANLEFNQFHPTCLYHPQARSFLISEAVRGEGGILKLPDGSRFMHHFDERAELAPRDIVARAIDHEMKRLGADCLYLDISHKPADFIRSHFPTIYEKCLTLGIDITKEPIPIVPAAHYTCGGVRTDLHARTDLDGLYAVGEVACTGLHGANRMASNSLLECLVFAEAAANDILAHWTEMPPPPRAPEWDESRVRDSDEEIIVAHNWHELRQLMWDYVGIVRSDKRLQRARRRIQLLKQEINEYYANFKVTSDLLELRNLVVVADLIVECASRRKESRGLHYSLDYPHMLPDAKDTILSPIDSMSSAG
ncbi:MAG: L-aspartate oxidase [Gammaproteobacteria bacterium]|nr:MAG: L-aspartate oxidase [Gammaproteobacteria bacterium]